MNKLIFLLHLFYWLLIFLNVNYYLSIFDVILIYENIFEDKMSRLIETANSNQCKNDLHNFLKPVLTNYTPIMFFHLYDGPENIYLDVEHVLMHKVVRFYEVNKSMHCMDFIVRVCFLLNLKPSEYTLIYQIQDSSKWGFTSPSSRLSDCIDFNMVNGRNSLTICLFRLVPKFYFKKVSKLYKQSMKMDCKECLVEHFLSSGKSQLEEVKNILC